MTARLIKLPTTRAELEQLREGWEFEAKLAAGRHGQGAVPDSFWETYSAMANTDGGWILLGAQELPDGTLELRGIRDVDRVERDLWNTLGNRTKVSSNVLSRDDVSRLEIDGRTLLVVRIPPAPRSARPVYINHSWERGTFVRVHAGDRRVPLDVARRMLADAVPERDAAVLTGFTLQDIDPESVRRYREMFAARRPEHPFLQYEGIEFLREVGAWAVDRERRSEGPTLAGLLMLGRERAIRERLPHWHLSYREVPVDPDDGRRWVDRVAPDGTWEANVFSFYLRVVPRLLAHLRVPFALDPDLFRRDETAVHEALREALVNALVHADYEGNGGIRIVRHVAGFELTNPGLPLVSVEQLWRGGTSEPRNPVLMRLFTLLQLGEREGSGGPAIRRAWKTQHWRLPTVRLDPERGETTLELRQESLLPDEAVQMLIQRWGSRFRELDELGRIILVTAQVEGSICHRRICELSDAHPRDITLKLQDLLRRGFLEPSGRGRTMTYALRTEEAREDDEALATQVATSLTQVATSLTQVATSPAQAEPSGRQSALERVRESGRISLEVIESAIVEACADGALTVEEIAVRIGRAPSTVRIKYLPALVRSGRLVLLHPDRPNHPGQAYRSTSRAEDDP